MQEHVYDANGPHGPYPEPHEFWNLVHLDLSPLSDEDVESLDWDQMRGQCACGWSTAAGHAAVMTIHGHRQGAKLALQTRTRRESHEVRTLARQDARQLEGQGSLF